MLVLCASDRSRWQKAVERQVRNLLRSTADTPTSSSDSSSRGASSDSRIGGRAAAGDADARITTTGMGTGERMKRERRGESSAAQCGAVTAAAATNSGLASRFLTGGRLPLLATSRPIEKSDEKSREIQ